MAVTQIDSRTALIVIDLQKSISLIPNAHSIENVVENANHLMASFRHQGLPVVLVNVVGRANGRTEQRLSVKALPPDWFEFLPELSRQPQDRIVSKQTWGAFTGTNLDAYLKSTEISQVVVCGVATSMGVESTARQAHELGRRPPCFQ